jgi:hypothetical protein
LVVDFKLSHEKAKEGFLASFQCIGSLPSKFISSQDSSKKKKQKQKRTREDQMACNVWNLEWSKEFDWLQFYPLLWRFF